jgi:pseudaminic acid biosynthesis-associated methylase
MIPTEQEAFWQGAFGDDYTARHRDLRWVAANTALFAEVLSRASGVRSVLELGSNIGLNLMALRHLLPEARLSAVEINAKAADELTSNVPGVDLHPGSILEVELSTQWDLVMTKGVLIHINPDKLPIVYSLMHRSSSRYLLVAEYYSPKPVEVLYKGHSGKLFKRDFAGEIMDLFHDVRLVDYGFVYHRDPQFPQDDITWFLMEKSTPVDATKAA